MKKEYLIFFNMAFLFLFSGCRNEVDLNSPIFSNRSISFTNLLIDGTASRNNNEPVGDEFPEDSRVGVFAYCLTNEGGSGNVEWNTKQHACIPFMPNMEANPAILKGVELKKSIDGSWAYTNGQTYNWYENDEDYLYSFFAYSPYDDKYFTLSTINHTEIDGKHEYKGAPIANFHLPFTSTEISSPLDRNELRDAMLSNNIDRKSSQGSVGFQFYHMTSGLRFLVNNYDNKHSITINSLTLSGTFNKQMSIKARTSYSVEGNYSGTFKIADAPLTVEALTTNSYFKVGGKPDASKVTLLLIPNITVDGQPIIGIPNGATPKLSINYQIEGETSSKDYEVDLPSMNYRVGVIHNISFDFLGNSLTVKATASEWDNEYISDIEFK